MENNTEFLDNIEVVFDGVLILPNDTKGKTSGGIFIPPTSLDKAHIGIIIKTGEGKDDEPMVLKVGDTVMYNKFEGTDIIYNKNKYLHLRQNQIWLIIE